MANPTVSNVASGKPLVTGGIWHAPLGSTLPTDATSALDAAFVGLGYVGEDGLTEAAERTTDKIKAWGGDTIKVVQTDFSATFSWSFAEATNGEALKVVYGEDNVTVVGNAIEIGVSSDQLPHACYVFEMQDGDNRMRIVVPDGQITEVGEITYTDGGIVLYQVTLEAFKDETGKQYYKYLENEGSGS